MKLNDIKIPSPLHFVLDDIGWIEGRISCTDDFRPTRTGLPRRHVLADYIAVNEICRTANMKICGMFVLGDWDRKGILKDVPYATKEGKNWKGSPVIDIEEEEEIRDYLNSCEYIEMAVHGLFHECWDEEGTWLSAEFVPPADFKKGNKGVPAPDWYVRAHLDAFYKIYNDWGFKHPLLSISCPGTCESTWKDGSYTKIFNEYGLRYWHQHDIPHPISDNGLLLNYKPTWLTPWETYDLNPDKFTLYTEETAGIIGTHWPQFLRFDPDLNLENIDSWKNYFDRQKNVFGVIIGRDMALTHHQLFYKYNSEITEENGKIKIDCSKVDENKPDWFDAPLYISVKNGVEFECEGGTMTVWEKLDEFTNYEIKRDDNGPVFLKPFSK